MYIKNRIISLVYKIILVAVCATGILLTCGFPQNFNFDAFKYYTVQSNFLCFVFFVAASVFTLHKIIKTGPSGPATLLPHFKGAVTIAITVTMLIYQFLLSDTPFSMGEGTAGITDMLVHLITPLLVILDWLLFDKKGLYRATDPIIWCVIPLLYFGWTLIAAQIGVTYFGGSRYPYPFIDVDALGWQQVLLTVLFLVAAFLVLNYIIFTIDKLLGRKKKNIPAQ